MHRILIVEDDLHARTGLGSLLTEEGYSVELVEDGASCLKRTDWDIDLLISDLRLPDISGIELARRVKQLRPDLLSIIMTAESEPARIIEARKSGVVCCLPKPLDLSRLLSLIKRVLAKDQSSDIGGA